MAEKTGYSVPTLRGSPKPSKRAAKAPTQTEEITGEQVVSEIMRVYRENDSLKSQNRVLAERIEALEDEQFDKIEKKLCDFALARLKEIVDFERSAARIDHGTRLMEVMTFDEWSASAIDKARVPNELSLDECVMLMSEDMVEAYSERAKEANRRIFASEYVASDAQERENERDR